MRNFRMLALGASLLVLAGACGTGGGSPTVTDPPASPTVGARTVRIGSAGFYESALIAEVYAQVLEAEGFSVDRQLQIGPRDVTFPALDSDQFDLMPEYIGSTLEFLAQQADDPAGRATNDPAETYRRLQERLDERGLVALEYTPAQDTNAFVVRPETAETHDLQQMSDLAAVQHELTWGLPPECADNPLCGGILRDEYDIEYAEIPLVELAACSGEMATALAEGAVDVGELCSTQPDIERFNLLVLADDQNTQPAENIAPIARADWLEAVGGKEAIAAILDPVSRAMSTEELTALNVRVGLDQEDFAVVARDWLEQEGLLP